MWAIVEAMVVEEHGGNPNLLMHLAEQRIVVVDHNLAFDQDHKVADLDLHVFRRAWESVRGDQKFKFQLREKMIRALAVTASLNATLPEEWLDAEPTFCLSAQEVLERVQGDTFWSELE
jgi:hypothetical protein